MEFAATVRSCRRRRPSPESRSRGAVESSGSDFEALYNLYRLAYDDRIDEPDQLRLWREES